MCCVHHFASFFYLLEFYLFTFFAKLSLNTTQPRITSHYIQELKKKWGRGTYPSLQETSTTSSLLVNSDGVDEPVRLSKVLRVVLHVGIAVAKPRTVVGEQASGPITAEGQINNDLLIPIGKVVVRC
jgi:hypothetical protein